MAIFLVLGALMDRVGVVLLVILLFPEFTMFFM